MVKVNDVFHDGYDFFQVVSVTKSTVTVRPIESEKVRDGDVRTAFDYDVVVRPKLNHFTTSYLFNATQNERGKRCKIHHYTTDPDGPVQIMLSSAFRHWAYQVTEDEVTVEHDYR